MPWILDCPLIWIATTKASGSIARSRLWIVILSVRRKSESAIWKKEHIQYVGK